MKSLVPEYGISMQSTAILPTLLLTGKCHLSPFNPLYNSHDFSQLSQYERITELATIYAERSFFLEELPLI
jgi:hypothetical protein